MLSYNAIVHWTKVSAHTMVSSETIVQWIHLRAKAIMGE
jgi:hypothetical protein